MTKIPDTWHRIGIEANRPINDAVAGCLPIAAGRHNQAQKVAGHWES
jgi:hypothetical protein